MGDLKENRIRKELIPLQHAHVNQHTVGAKKTVWSIRANITEELLGELPNKLDDNEVFAILEIMRKYEQDAFNIGINFGKEKYKNIFEPQLIQLKEINRLAANENERLAEVLDKEQNRILIK